VPSAAKLHSSHESCNSIVSGPTSEYKSSRLCDFIWPRAMLRGNLFPREITCKKLSEQLCVIRHHPADDGEDGRRAVPAISAKQPTPGLPFFQIIGNHVQVGNLKRRVRYRFAVRVHCLHAVNSERLAQNVISVRRNGHVGTVRQGKLTGSCRK